MLAVCEGSRAGMPWGAMFMLDKVQYIYSSTIHSIMTSAQAAMCGCVGWVHWSTVEGEVNEDSTLITYVGE